MTEQQTLDVQALTAKGYLIDVMPGAEWSMRNISHLRDLLVEKGLTPSYVSVNEQGKKRLEDDRSLVFDTKAGALPPGVIGSVMGMHVILHSFDAEFAIWSKRQAWSRFPVSREEFLSTCARLYDESYACVQREDFTTYQRGREWVDESYSSWLVDVTVRMSHTRRRRT